MEFNGLKWSDFSDEMAMTLSDELLKSNAEEYGHTGAAQVHPKFWQLSKYWYVKSSGLKRARRFTSDQSVEVSRDDEAGVKEGIGQVLGSASEYSALEGADKVSQQKQHRTIVKANAPEQK